MVVHSGRGGEPNGLADLTDGGGVAALAHVPIDHLEDLALATREVRRRHDRGRGDRGDRGDRGGLGQGIRHASSVLVFGAIVKHLFPERLFVFGLDDERAFVP